MTGGELVGSTASVYTHEDTSSLKEIRDNLKLFDKLMKNKAKNVANGKLVTRTNVWGNLEYILAKER